MPDYADYIFKKMYDLPFLFTVAFIAIQLIWLDYYSFHVI